MTELKNEVFILPTSNEDRFIIYFPLRSVSFLANEKAADIIQNYLMKGIDIPQEHKKLHKHIEDINKIVAITPKERKIDTNKAVFILSQKCNLACNYCYAQDARSQDTISNENIKTVVDYIFSNRSNDTKEFSFIGGGEPTIDWDLLVWAIEYIKDNCKNQKIYIGLTTNATLLNETKILWLKNNNINVGVSFDILPEIQNKQRPFPDKSKNSFEIVDKNFKLLVNSGLTTRIRSTITDDSVTLMPEMVRFVVDNYPQIKRLHFEPVTDPKHDMKDFYDKYIEYFFISRNFGKTKGIDVYNSIVNSARKIQTKFCSGEFCITPRGEIVSCHRVSATENLKFDDFYYGKVGSSVEIEKLKLEHITNVSNNKTPQCVNCFAKWHCAGMCTNNRSLFSQQQLSSSCNFIKTMITKTLENRYYNVL
jgi:radical SAM protein with 4Fe4S-binding SPASM domain